jgi:hypothetical protein
VRISVVGGLAFFGSLIVGIFRRVKGWRRPVAVLGIAMLLAAAAIEPLTSWNETPLILAGIALTVIPLFFVSPRDKSR